MPIATDPRAARRAFLRACLIAPIPALLAACAGASPQPTVAPAPTSAPVATDVPAPTSAPAATDVPAPTAAPAPTSAPAATDLPAPTAAPAAQLPLTPACADDDDLTIAQTEGPYFTPNSPERSNFVDPGMAGTPMTLIGAVYTSDCRPVARALLDLWHCDDAGVYDNAGYTLRGHMFTDDQGRFQFETIRPGLYPGRTRHFHIKVQAPNGPILTTQLYFPEEPDNNSDGIFAPELLMDVQPAANGLTGTYTFVIQEA